MQGTKPKIISIGNFKRETSVDNLVAEKKLVVSGNKFKYDEVKNRNESLGSFSLQRSRCRKRNPKSAKTMSFCKKNNSEADGGNLAKSYQEK